MKPEEIIKRYEALIEKNEKSIERHRAEVERWKGINNDWVKLDKQAIQFFLKQNLNLRKLIKDIKKLKERV